MLPFRGSQALDCGEISGYQILAELCDYFGGSLILNPTHLSSGITFPTNFPSLKVKWIMGKIPEIARHFRQIQRHLMIQGSREL